MGEYITKKTDDDKKESKWITKKDKEDKKEYITKKSDKKETKWITKKSKTNPARPHGGWTD